MPEAVDSEMASKELGICADRDGLFGLPITRTHDADALIGSAYSMTNVAVIPAQS